MDTVLRNMIGTTTKKKKKNPNKTKQKNPNLNKGIVNKFCLVLYSLPVC